MRDFAFVALCLVVPVLWGVLSARLYDWWQARLAARRPAASDGAAAGGAREAAERELAAGPDMYYI